MEEDTEEECVKGKKIKEVSMREGTEKKRGIQQRGWWRRKLGGNTFGLSGPSPCSQGDYISDARSTRPS